MLYSPNGEPLNGGPLGQPTCEEAMSRWFASVDTNHDSMISHDEFMADAQIQFQRMDIDKNGYLVSEELERFRLPYRQQATALTSTSGQNSDSGGPEGQHKHGRGSKTGDPDSGSGLSDQKDFPDPVMSADTNNDFKVTLNEFMIQAENTFMTLDASHKELLSRDEVLKLCGKPTK